MRYAALLLFLFTIANIAGAQTSHQELERRRQSILASIRESQDQLDATKKDKNATMSQLRALQAKLDGRLRLIDNINEEMSAITGTIQLSNQEVGQLRQKLDLLKARYAQSIRYSYRNRSSYNMLAFLLSSNSYSDAVRRLKYLKRYRDYRTEQAEEIRQTQGFIENKITDLNKQKTQKDMLLSAQEEQKQELVKETNQTNNVVKELKGREKELTADIAKNAKIAKQMEHAINALIAREIEDQRRKAIEEQRKKDEDERKAAAALAARNAAAAKLAAANANAYGSGNNKVNLSKGSDSRNNDNGSANNNPVATTKPATTNNNNIDRPVPNAAVAHARPIHNTTTAAQDLIMTPEVRAMSNSFRANRGRLPWPVDQGAVMRTFGEHPNPIQPLVKEFCNGIDIRASAGAKVHAVFEGKVTAIFFLEGSGQIVMITHGDYFTVYTNLSSVDVKKGDNVTTRQVIGTAGQNEDGIPMLQFQVWQSKNKQNPALWLAPMH